MSDWKSRLSERVVPPTAVDVAPAPAAVVAPTLSAFEPSPNAAVRLLGRRSVAVTALAIAPDAQTLVASHADGQVQLLRAGTGLALHTFALPAEVQSLAISPDGRWLAVALPARRPAPVAMCELRLINLRHGTQEHTIEIPGAAVQALSFDPSGRLLAVAAGSSLGLWDAWSGHPTQPLKGHVDRIGCLAFSPDGAWLVSGDAAGLLQTWHVATGQPGARLQQQGDLSGLALSGDGRWLAWGARDGTVLVSHWAPQGIERVRQIEGQGAAVAGLRFSPDHRWLVIGKRAVADASAQATVRLWSTEAGELQAEHAVPGVALACLAVSPCGRWLALGGGRGEVCMIASEDGRLLRRFPCEAVGVSCLALSPDGQWLVSGREDGAVGLWQPQKGELLREMKVHTGPVKAVAFSSDGRWWASGADDGTVLLWGRGRAHPLRARRGLRCLDFCPHGRWLALAGSSGAVQLLPLRDPLPKELVLVHQGGPALVGLCFSAHGQLLVWADQAGKVTCWDPVSHHVRSSPTLPVRALETVAVSDDLRWLAASGRAGELLLWDLNVDRAVWQRQLPGGAAQHLRFDADSAVLHAAGEDGSQSDWAVASGDCQAQHVAPAAHLACRGLVPAGRALHDAPLADDSIRLV